MNEVYWLITLVISLLGVLIVHKFFGKGGLYVWTAIALIVANIQAVKSVTIFGLDTVLGTIIYSTAFIAMNILIEKYGKKEALKTLGLSLTSMIIVTVIMGITTLYHPNASDTANDSLNLIFGVNIRIMIGSILAYLISGLCNISIYQKLSEKYHKMWLSNGVSILVAQLIDTVIFLGIAFIGIHSINTLIELFIARYVFKLIVMVISTPVIYLDNNMKID
jgi:uncharacterized integral membrane protein (TIGR00697 family)